MKRGVSRESFQSTIIKIIYSISDRNVVDDITDKLVSQKGFERGLASDIMQGNAQYDMLSAIELGAILDTIYKITLMPIARLENYLEEAEISQVNKFKYQTVNKKDKKQLLIFEDVRQVARDIWTVVVPAKRIVDLYRANKITYNPETQRDPKIIRNGDTIISTINVNAASVEAIRDELISRTFIPNTITFNVPMVEDSGIRYDSNQNRLIVVGGMDILDGYHRSAGIVAASRYLSGNLDYNFELRITNFNVEKARRFIVQEDKRNTISREYIKSIDTTDYISNIINDINESGRSELRGKITTEQSLVKSGKALVTFDLMYSVMDKLWNPKNMSDTEDITKYLIAFFNKTIQEDNIKSSSIAFYLALAKELEDKDDWDKRLEDVMSELNMKNGISQEIEAYNMSEIKRNTDRFIDLSRQKIREAN